MIPCVIEGISVESSAKSIFAYLAEESEINSAVRVFDMLTVPLSGGRQLRSDV